MSKKLDYFTIGIVALCIIAIIFLLYKMTDLLSNKEDSDVPGNNIEQVVDDADTDGESDDIYDYEADEPTGTDGDESVLDETSGQSKEASVEDEAISDDDKNIKEVDDPEPDNTMSDNPYPKGKYMVLAGTFKVRQNADNFAKTLKRKDYNNARVALFDRGAYAVVLVDRFDSLSKAKSLAGNLKKEGVEAYVKKAR